MKTSLELIHYGSDSFNTHRFREIADVQRIKPIGGLWASPVDAQHGWKQWCEDADFGKEALKKHFLFNYTGNTLIIDKLEDLGKLPWYTPMEFFHFILFQPLLLQGYDAIYLTEKGEHETRLTFPRNLYGWDCESVLVMNPKCIEIIK